MIAALMALALGAESIPDVVAQEIGQARASLTFPDSPPIYYLRARLVMERSIEVRASLGAPVMIAEDTANALGIELRVGDPSYDQTGLTGLWGILSNGFVVRGLPDDLTPESVRLAMWRATDDAFKGAVEHYSRKKAQIVLPEDHPGDYAMTGPVVADDGRAEASDVAPLVAIAEQLSAVWSEFPELEVAEVLLGHEAGESWVIDTEGTRVRSPVAETSVRAIVRMRAPDGMWLSDQRLWTVRDPSSLPLQAMQAAARGMATELVALSRAPALKDEYVGPVLLEGAAAGDLFRYLLLPQLLGTPPERDFESFFGEIGGSSGGARVLRRVLPPGWSVVDDPTSAVDHPGGYRHDDEGTAAQAVALVTDGIVRDLVMSRTPREGLRGSNGHGRSPPGQREIGRLAITAVQPDRSLSEAALRRRALKAAAAYGRDSVLVVRRLLDPASMDWPEGDYVDPAELPLPHPVEVVMLFADGHEERLRGAAFAGTARYLLRDVLAAGRMEDQDYLAPFALDEYEADPLVGIPCRISAPAVLLGEMEIIPRQGDPADIPVIPRPGLEAR